MGRVVLVAGAFVWAAGALVALGIAFAGVDWLSGLLPPLAIDADALGATFVAIGSALLVAAGAHVVVLAALRRGVRSARSVAVLMCATALATFVALAAAAFASAAAEPELAIPLVAAGVGAAVVGAGYAAATLAFVIEIRSRGAS